MERIEVALQRAKEQRLSSVLPSQASSGTSRVASEAAWTNLPLLSPAPALLAKNRIVTLNRSNLAHAAFDMMRTRLLQKLRENNWTTVAITSPTPGCGKSLVGLNLAFSLAKQKECRTVLVDLDLRRPQVGQLLGLKATSTMENFLRGRGDMQDLFVRYGDNVAIGPNSQSVRLSSELLQSPSATVALKELRRKLDPHVVIYDMPPMLSSDDVIAFVPNVDCAILVVAAESTTLREADICERDLAEKTNVAGVVLNKCRYTPEKYGY